MPEVVDMEEKKKKIEALKAEVAAEEKAKPRPNIEIQCQCGESMNAVFEWDINIVGILEFKCPKCSAIYRTAGLWPTTTNMPTSDPTNVPTGDLK